MRDTQLLKPGTSSTSNRLRREVAYAISRIEQSIAGGGNPEAAELAAFLADAGTKVPGAVPADQAIVTTGTLDDITVTGTGTTLTLTVSGGKITAAALS